ncbi:MAG: hypothetical protein KJ646_00655 [Nanoarchaeota archaeon]|nr:hypothetical protein [Nanoarchaeota archaeon]MBU4117003.1 hypothetical protein [Nanoarchaeota archaeon]
MIIKLNKSTRVTTREINLYSSACDFLQRQFKKSPISTEKEGYAKESKSKDLYVSITGKTRGVLAWLQ